MSQSTAAALGLDDPGRHPSIYLPGSGNVLGYFEKALGSRAPSPECGGGSSNSSPFLFGDTVLDCLDPTTVAVEASQQLPQGEEQQGGAASKDGEGVRAEEASTTITPPSSSSSSSSSCPITLDQGKAGAGASGPSFRDRDRQRLLQEWQEKKAATKAIGSKKGGRTPLGTLSQNRTSATRANNGAKPQKKPHPSTEDVVKPKRAMGPPDASKENKGSLQRALRREGRKAAATVPSAAACDGPESRLFPIFVPAASSAGAPEGSAGAFSSSPPVPAAATEKMFPMMFSPPENPANKRKRNGRKKARESPSSTGITALPVEGNTQAVGQPADTACSLADYFAASAEKGDAIPCAESQAGVVLTCYMCGVNDGTEVAEDEHVVVVIVEDDAVPAVDEGREQPVVSDSHAENPVDLASKEGVTAQPEEEGLSEDAPTASTPSLPFTPPPFRGSTEAPDTKVEDLPQASKEQLIKALDDLIVLEQAKKELEDDKLYLAAALAERDEEAARWENEYEEAKSKVEELQSLLELAQTEIKDLRTQLDSSSHKLKAEAADKQELQNQLSRREKEVAELRAELTEARDLVKTLEAKEKQASESNAAQMAFCSSQQEKLVATQQMLCDFQTRADVERQRLEQELEHERHRRRAFEDVTNSVLRAVGLCGLNALDLRPDNPEGERLILQRVSELATSLADRAALEKEVAHLWEVVASQEKKLTELPKLEQEKKDQLVTIKRLQESNREIQREHGAAVLLAKKTEKEANNFREQAKQAASSLAEAQGRIKALDSHLIKMEQEKLAALEEGQEAMARLRASQDEVDAVERKLTATTEEAEAMRREIQTLREDLTRKHQEEHRLRHEIEKREELLGELRKGAKGQRDMMATLEEDKKRIQALQRNAQAQEKERSELMAQNAALKCTVEEFRSQTRLLNSTNEHQSARLKHLEAEAVRHEVVRRSLHNQVVELKGNIRVFVRVRPPLRGEDSHLPYRFLDTGFGRGEMESRQLEVIYKKAGNRSGLSAELQRSRFGFDRVFNPSATQCQVFAEVHPIIQSAIDGYKVCIFAYGQTGSGKTFTMMGPADDPMGEKCGLTPRATELIFDTCARLREKGWDFRFSMEMMEIYCEKVRDLLTDGAAGFADGPSLEVRHHAEDDGGPVPGLTTVHVTQACEVMALLSRALAKRCTKATQVNVDSSRSHCIFTLNIEGTSPQGNLRRGCLHLIDLAGSERLSKSGSANNQSMLEEAKAINKSLSALSEVISALYRKDPHVPFRNSKLTSVLRNSLGGDSKCLMFANLSPSESSVQESLCSLRFANKVQGCITSSNGQKPEGGPPSRSSSPARGRG